VSKKILEQWNTAHNELAEAEIEVIDWELRNSEPVPSWLRQKVDLLRDRVAFLFEIASTRLAFPDTPSEFRDSAAS